MVLMVFLKDQSKGTHGQTRGLRKEYSTGNLSMQMVTHPDINPIQQCLTSLNRREAVFPFGTSRTQRRVRAVSFGPSRPARVITNSV